MDETIALVVVCIIAGVAVNNRSTLLVGACVAAAWLIGRAHG
jgi:hypothetical protein